MIGLALIAQLALAPSSVPPSLHGGGGGLGVEAEDSIPVVTLAEALDRAVKLDPSYVRALGSVAEADWSRKAARVAFLVPALTASLDYTKYSQAFFNIGTFNQSSTSSTFQLAASYELFSARKFMDLGRTAAELEGATATEVQQRFVAALLTESAYYTVLSDGELTRVAGERATRAVQQLELARARVMTGAAVQSDSLTVRLELVRAQVDLLRRASSLRVARLELGRRVGVDGPVEAAPLDSAPPAPLPIDLRDAVAQALEQGPDYRVARARERSANAVLSGRRGAYLPTLTLSAAHSRFDVKLFPGASNVSSVTVTASLPIWDNGQRELSILRARADRDVARAVRTDLELAAQRDVTEAYDGYETARAAVTLASDGVTVARENYRVQGARYKGGVTTVLDLLTAQNGLSDAEAGLVQARYAARLALARLEAILGTRLVFTNGGPQ
jgi:outer membrane protein